MGIIPYARFLCQTIHCQKLSGNAEGESWDPIERCDFWAVCITKTEKYTILYFNLVTEYSLLYVNREPTFTEYSTSK